MGLGVVSNSARCICSQRISRQQNVRWRRHSYQRKKVWETGVPSLRYPHYIERFFYLCNLCDYYPAAVREKSPRSSVLLGEELWPDIRKRRKSSLVAVQLRFADLAWDFSTDNNWLQHILKTEERKVVFKFVTQMQVLRLDFVPCLSILCDLLIKETKNKKMI